MDAIIAVQHAVKIVERIKNVLRPELSIKITKEFSSMGFWMSRIEPGTFLSEPELTGLVFIIIDQFVNKEISMNLTNVKPELPDDLNPDYIFSMTATSLLVQIACGEIDPLDHVMMELASRGIGKNGKWIGFKEAAKEWKVKKK